MSATRQLGRPASTAGNLMIWISTLVPRVLENIGTLRGVVTIVAFTPRSANSLAMSIVGIRWPWAIKGKKNM
nr:hypothetical protein CFP56_13945 [Quercus suber]